MAMDIQGRKPSSAGGKHFRTEFWSWRPIHALIRELCPDLFDEKTLKDMAFSNGAGPPDQKTCMEIAARFKKWMEQHRQGFVLESGIRVTEDGRFVTEKELAENPSLETVSPYEVGDNQLKRWVEFLRCCGGFEVW